MSGNRFHKFLFLSLLFPLSALTAPSPNDAKDIAITSQAFEYNHTTGIAIYTGNVYAEQGTRKLWGDELQIFRGDKGDISKIIVTGLPAKIEQEGDIYEAPLIEYDPIKDTVRSPQNEKGQTTITLKPRAKS
jgi:lipopolysaccharide export system protein LptA